MTRLERESLDDLIDRVASDLTYVSADAGLSDHLVSRLGERPSLTGMWMTTSAFAAAVVAAVVISLPERTDRERLVVDTPTPAAIELRPATRQTVEPVVVSLAVASPSNAAGVRRTRFDRASRLPSAIPALEPPPILALDGLTVDALTVPAVEITHIEMPSLAIDELTSSPDSKE